MGQVIKGFERGIVGMKVGGVRKITIPPDLGYGRKGQPPVIPPNATLHFEVELMAIK
jgi:FKBP-type peptidyl-prolyl cis-trans isomerase